MTIYFWIIEKQGTMLDICRSLHVYLHISSRYSLKLSIYTNYFTTHLIFQGPTIIFKTNKNWNTVSTTIYNKEWPTRDLSCFVFWKLWRLLNVCKHNLLIFKLNLCHLLMFPLSQYLSYSLSLCLSHSLSLSLLKSVLCKFSSSTL